MKKFPIIFLSDSSISSEVAREVRGGRARKIGPRLYTTNMKDNPERIVQQNWWQVLSLLVPGGVVSHRTSLESSISPAGRVYVTGQYPRTFTLPGLEIVQMEGVGPLEDDMPMMTFYLASQGRAFLENLAPSRARRGEAKALYRDQIERRLADLLRTRGENELNALRDQARSLATELSLEKEFREMDQLVGSLLGTRNADLKEPVAQAYARNEPYDPNVLERVDVLRAFLVGQVLPVRTQLSEANTGFYNVAFFDAYFSNYIEGTRFEIDEALQIVESGRIPERRPEDGHDVLGTYQIVASLEEMIRTPGTSEEFFDLLTQRHSVILAGRSERNPGVFKTQVNFTGSTRFVDPDLVEGTLKQGFEYYRSLEDPFARSLVMMFLITEVHPFEDGNGRIARIMMNAELVAANQTRIIIPSVFRNEYISGLKRLTNHQDPRSFVRIMEFAQIVVSRIDFSDMASAKESFEECNAFADPAEDVRLRLPPGTGFEESLKPEPGF